MTKEQQFNQEERQLSNAMDKETEIRQGQKFIPVVGMKPKIMEGHGYKGVIEYVGKDYFILRSFRTDLPVLINPIQYYNFVDYELPEVQNLEGANIPKVFKNILDNFFPNPTKTPA